MSVTNQAVAGRRRAPKAWPALFCLAVLAQATPPAAAETVDIRNVTNANGDVVFVVEIYGADAPFWYSGVNEYSPRNYTAAEKSAITLGAEYWAAVLKPNSAPFAPGIVRIGMDTATTFNAFTYYYGGPGGFGLMFQALQGPTDMRQPSNVAGDVSPDPHTLIEFHNIAWDTQASSSVPETATDMTAVFIHEMGHSLGITGGNPDWQDLVGSGGTAGAGYADRNPYPGVAGTLNFYGPTAMALYGGPVPLAHGSSQETSHFGIRNGLMTHGQISNYAMFTEVELAAIKDIGYDVDLRAFYGRSYYDDDRLVTKTVVSSAGFYDSKGLNPGGTWLGYNVGRPNLSPWGVGLHIFGSAYDITQTADLLADGRSGAGVRVDGFENTVRINPGVRVTAEGTQGTGLLVAFGSGHVINSQGSISATGSMGIGARFDFGAPYVAYRLMSYGRYPENDAIGTWLNIGGPLVEEFNLSGALLGGASNPDGQWLSGEFVDYDGRDIALYIGPGAHVANINVMNGASISGDIISRWDPAAHPSPVVNTDPESYMTNLTFGLAGNGSGGVTASPDINFFLNYRGNITGPESLNVSLHGGTLEYSGAMNVYSFTTGANTTLLAGFQEGGGPTTITATTSIVTDPTSHIGFGQTSLVYGAPQGTGPKEFLVFDAPSQTHGASVLQSSGTYSVGAYDYQWNRVFRSDDLTTYYIDVEAVVFNEERGGTDMANASINVLMRTPGLDAVNNRMTRRAAALEPCLGTPRLDPDAASMTDEERERWCRTGLWIAPGGSTTSHHGHRDFTVAGPGLTAGVDYAVRENAWLGAALALDDAGFDSDDASVESRTVAGHIYGGAFLPFGFDVGFTGSLGQTRFDARRSVAERYLDSDFSATTRGLGLTLGRAFNLTEAVSLRPFADWNLFRFTRDAWQEDADPYALKFSADRNDIHRVRLGADAVWQGEHGFLTAKAFWNALRGDTTDETELTFVLDPGANAFTVDADGLDRDSLGLGLGGGLKLGESAALRFDYTLLTGSDTTTHQGTVNFRLLF